MTIGISDLNDVANSFPARPDTFAIDVNRLMMDIALGALSGIAAIPFRYEPPANPPDELSPALTRRQRRRRRQRMRRRLGYKGDGGKAGTRILGGALVGVASGAVGHVLEPMLSRAMSGALNAPERGADARAVAMGGNLAGTGTDGGSVDRGRAAGSAPEPLPEPLASGRLVHLD